IGSENMGPVEHSRGQRSQRKKSAGRLEQLVLLGEHLVELRLDEGNSTLGLPDVKAIPQLDGQKFVRDVERRHHRDAVGAVDFAGGFYLAILPLQGGTR